MNESQIAGFVTPILGEHGLDLDAVEVLPAGRRRLVRIVVDGDGPAGKGPLLDDIAAATRAVSAALDESPLVGSAPYTLEVSSRGVSRPLELPRHWRRNVDRLVAVTTAGGESFTGRILTAGEAEVTLEVDGVPRTVALTEVGKALVQVELNRKTAPGGSPDDDADDDGDSDDPQDSADPDDSDGDDQAGAADTATREHDDEDEDH